MSTSPAGTRVTDCPCASTSEIVKPGPTTPVSFVSAAPATAATASRRRRPARVRPTSPSHALYAHRRGSDFAHPRSSAPWRSARSATIRSRATATSSSVSVRSGDWKARWRATDFRPGPTCSPRYTSKTRASRSVAPAASCAAATSAPASTSSSDRDGDVLPVRRVGDHVVVEDPLGDGRHQRLDVELEDAPAPLEERRVQLAEPARVRLGRLAGMQLARATRAARRAGCGAPRRAPRRPPAPPRSRPRRSRRRASAPRGAARPRRAGTRARARRGGRPSLPASTLTRAASTRPASSVVRSTACSPLIGSGSRSARGSGSRRREAPRVRLGEAGADEHVLDARRNRCSGVRWPATERRRGIVCGTRSSTARATSSTRSISRVHVARAPRRDRHVPPRPRLEAEAAEDRALLVVGHLEADQAAAPAPGGA